MNTNNNQPTEIYALEADGEALLTQIANNRFEVKHQLVLSMLIAATAKQQAPPADIKPLAPENEFNIEALLPLYMLMHHIDYEDADKANFTDEVKHGRIKFLERKCQNLELNYVKALNEIDELKAAKN